MDMKTVSDIATVVTSVAALVVSIVALKANRRGTAASELSAITSQKSANAAEQSLEAAKLSAQANIAMFKRQGVIELHATWREIHQINPLEPITPHVVDAANALELTASMWNHDIIEREILYQLFWGRYRLIYASMNSGTPVPGLDAKLWDMLSAPVTKAYREMQNYDSSKVAQSTVDS
jgi:hypothetical protein